MQFKIRHLFVFVLFVAAVISAYAAGHKRGVDRGLERGRWIDRESDFQNFAFCIDDLLSATGLDAKQLMGAIRDNVLPYSWHTNGGSAKMTITTESNQPYLVVHHSVDAFREIEKYLETFRTKNGG